MGKSILVFVSHSSEDKASLVEPIVADLEDCFINVWLDKRKILPGDNLRKSIFREGLDKADIALIFFTEKSLNSSWVDREIKHVLREESKKGNDFDLKKIISIFDSHETYIKIAERYPELTDDLLHLMPIGYSKIQLGQLISAIWSKYLSLQGGDIEIQKQLLAKDKEIFQKDKEIQSIKVQLEDLKSKNQNADTFIEFEAYVKSGLLNDLIRLRESLLKSDFTSVQSLGASQLADAVAIGLIKSTGTYISLTNTGKEFFKWMLLNKDKLSI